MSEEMSSLQGRLVGTTEENIQAAVRHAPQPSLELCERLRNAVAVAANRDAESIAILRRTISEFTKAMRDAGEPPERVLVTLKSTIGIGTLPPLSRGHPDWAGFLLREKMSTWCIHEYFDDTTTE
ncbi:MAG: hypothetical protein M3Z17_04030 [Gemmatimonadota bacterium]|nr:hypothetical protein [Gemmatimonadota bacterium]